MTLAGRWVELGPDQALSSSDSPALVKPAAIADSSVSNHTSAVVCSNHWPSGVWYFIESSLPLIGNPSGATLASSSGTLDPAYLPDVPPSVSSKTSASTPSTTTTVSSAAASSTGASSAAAGAAAAAAAFLVFGADGL